jgi:hypothetical protein
MKMARLFLSCLLLILFTMAIGELIVKSGRAKKGIEIHLISRGLR